MAGVIGLVALAETVEVILVYFLTGVVEIAAAYLCDGAGEGEEGFQGGYGRRDGRDGGGRRALGGVAVFLVGEGGGGSEVPFRESNGEPGGEELGGAFGHEAAGFFEVLRGGAGIAGAIKEVVTGLPFEEAALTPLGKVLRNDGVSLEEVAEDLLDFGEGVEPLDKGDAGDVAFEAAVEFLPDFSGEAGDFSVSCHEEWGLCRTC
jgi:hypothetical protein